MQFSESFKAALAFSPQLWQDVLNQRCVLAWLDSAPSNRVTLQSNGWVCSQSPRYRLLCTYQYAISFTPSIAQGATKLYVGNAVDGWQLEFNLNPPEPHFLVTGIPVYFAPKSLIIAYPAT